jgi:hypothetical protein
LTRFPGVEAQTLQVGGVEAPVEPPGQRPLDRLGLLVDLFVHEVGMAPLLVGLGGELDGRGLLGGRQGFEGGGAVAVGPQDSELSVVEVDHLRGMPNQGGHVGRGQHLPLPQPEDDRAPVARHHRLVRPVGADHRHPEGPRHRRQGLTDRLGQVHRAGEGDEVGEHLGVCVGDQLHAEGGQLRPQLGSVLDDPVVDHRHPAGLVGVRMGVHVRGLPVGGPAGVGDPR